MFDRILGTSLAASALLGLATPAMAQDASADSTDYAKALTCEAIYALLSETGEGEEENADAELAGFLAETWHEYIATTYPDGFEERHEAEFGKVADELVDTLNGMDDSNFDSAVDQLLTTCEGMETDPAFLG